MIGAKHGLYPEQDDDVPSSAPHYLEGPISDAVDELARTAVKMNLGEDVTMSDSSHGSIFVINDRKGYNAVLSMFDQTIKRLEAQP